jgi:hypothetical protein
MLRLNATLLESTRLYQAGVIGADSLIDSITGVYTKTPAMELGSAFHAVFEDPDKYLDLLDDAGVYDCQGHTFDAQAVDAAVSDIWAQAPVIEAKAEDLVLQTDYGPVRIVCKADALVGLECFELKTSQKVLKPERYMDSMQWRAYVLAFGANKVTYRLVQLKYLKYCDVWTVHDRHTISVFPYPQIKQDVTATANELARFIDIHNLNDYRLEKAA